MPIFTYLHTYIYKCTYVHVCMLLFHVKTFQAENFVFDDEFPELIHTQPLINLTIYIQGVPEICLYIPIH